MKKPLSILLILFCLSVFASHVSAGNINPPGPPSAGSGMITMQELYDYLTTGKAPPVPGLFKEPVAGPGSTGKSIQEIYNEVQALFGQCDAGPADVSSGVIFFNTDPDNWGPTQGTGKVPVSLGEICVDNSDCDDGLVCVSGVDGGAQWGIGP